ncbi:hypothetical protein QJS10_CPA08g00168 [Acorus calamus]|uniref:Large ribosomal subunit protein bL12 oligomerization domain-containing protein n=1 Tax=Acorus calamus TaxID=4465 RepID=A0AAV9E8I6_ACOCL|nr:hypothetical protein QJS10_CPA08g00168 [Acorus calamus]
MRASRRAISTISSLLLQNPKTPSPNLTKPYLRPFSAPAAASESPLPPPPPPPRPTPAVSAIVDEISDLTLMEVTDLADLLRHKLDVKDLPVMAVMMPGMGVPGPMGGGRGGGGVEDVKAEEEEEKTAFDVKLEGFDAAEKIVEKLKEVGAKVVLE